MIMKRKALLIGYSDVDSYGNSTLNIRKDINGYKNFLMSIKGGAWYDTEIVPIINESLKVLRGTIEDTKNENNDVVFVAFTGHGDYDDVENYCRRLEITDGDTILEKDLWGLAKRQILICDSCSGLRSEYVNESLLEEKSVGPFAKASNSLEIKARERYDLLCKLAPEQLVRLYASKIGTYAIEDNGGIYTQTLLQVLNNHNEDINIVRAHDLAADLVIKKTKYNHNDENAQIPQKSIPRIHTFLPGVINV